MDQKCMLLLETEEQETRQGFGWVEELQNRGETDNWIKDILDIEAAIEDKIANLGLKQLNQESPDDHSLVTIVVR